MEKFIFFLIIGLVVFDFLLNQWLDFLNYKNRNEKLPEELSDVFDAEKYDKQQRYENVNYRFSRFSSIFSFLLILGMLLFNGFAFLDSSIREFIDTEIWVSLVFFGILFLASDLIQTPFSIYDTFVIEEKFGFNKTTVKTFILDKIKSWSLGIVLGGLLLYLIIRFYLFAGPDFWIYAWGLLTFVMLFMLMFYSNLIVPLFNKQTPLEEGPLREAIESFAQKAGFQLKNIYVINGSKRSTKANAYFTGLGPKKRIVLYDTLINDLEEEEVVAVLAHEIGHYKHRHQVKGLFISLIQSGVTLFLLSLFLRYPIFSKALGSDIHSFQLGLIAFGILYSPISLLTGLTGNYFSRKNEYQADAFAKEYGMDSSLISSLKKLSRNNLSKLTPHPWYVVFHYSHPTLLQRIRALK